MMHRIPCLLPVLLFPLFIAACSLPVQVATFVADGISLFSTDKTVSDHGISMAMDKDCAVWRGLKGDEICKDEAKDGVMTASQSGPVASPPAAGRPALAQVESVEKEVLSAIPATVKPLSNPRQPAARQPAGVLALAEPNSLVAFGATPVVKQARPADVAQSGQNSQGGGAKSGYHFVLASFSIRGNAEKLLHLNAGLSPKVMTAKVKDRTMYRVIVGPVAPERRKTTSKRLAKTGFADVWGIHLKPGIGVQGNAMLAALP